MRGIIIVNRLDNMVRKLLKIIRIRPMRGIIIVNRRDNIVKKIVEDYTDQVYARYYYCQSSG